MARKEGPPWERLLEALVRTFLNIDGRYTRTRRRRRTEEVKNNRVASSTAAIKTEEVAEDEADDATTCTQVRVDFVGHFLLLLELEATSTVQGDRSISLLG